MSAQEATGAGGGGGRGRRRKIRDVILAKALQDNRRALYHCNYCQKDISHVPHIKCAECKDFDLCLECFSVGAEIKPHKNTHDYQVVENLSFPIYHPDWGADEEILLLEAIDQYGLGNWGGIAEHVGCKTPAQCREHYFQVYIDHENIPMPKPTPEMDQVDLDECIRRARAGFARSQYRPNGGAAAGADGRGTSEPPGAPSPGGDAAMEDVERPADAATPAGDAAGNGEGSGPGPLAASGGGEGALGGKGLKRQRHEQQVAEEQAAAAHDGTGAAGTHVVTGGRSMHHDPPQAGLPASGSKAPRTDGGVADASGQGKPYGASDATGFHAKRMEFDPEFDNDAECIVADMEFTDNDTPADVQQKVQMLMLYNRRLDERERRRAFVLERGVLNARAAQLLEKKRNTQEKDLYARMRVFTRYQPQPLHEEFVEGLLLEARLRTRIAELREYRRNGIRTFADAEVYDTEKRRLKAASDAASAAASAVHGQPYGGPGRGAAAAAAKAARAAAASGGMPPQSFGLVGEDGMPLGLPGPGPSAASTAVATSVASSSSFDLSRPAASVPMGRGAGAALALWRAKRGVPLDITCLPGVELLSTRERELCAATRLLPAHYLALKDMLLRDCEKNGSITRQEARSFFRLDPHRSVRIYDLLVAAGWIKGSGTGKGGGAIGSGQMRAITAGGELDGEDGPGADAMDVDDQGMDE